MKFAIFLLVIFTLIPISISAQTEEEVEVEFPFAYTQSVVRNSDGQLIVYQENYSPRLGDNQLFNRFLDHELEIGEAKLTLIDIGQETLEMIQFESTEVFESDQLRAWDSLVGKINDEYYNLAIIFHEGYPVSEGDVLTITWTFVRQNV